VWSKGVFNNKSAGGGVWGTVVLDIGGHLFLAQRLRGSRFLRAVRGTRFFATRNVACVC